MDPPPADTLAPMERMVAPVNWRDHITVDSEICHGEACIAGTRIPVTTVLANLAAGLDPLAIAESYPSVTPEAVRAAMSYAAELAKERSDARSGSDDRQDSDPVTSGVRRRMARGEGMATTSRKYGLPQSFVHLAEQNATVQMEVSHEPFLDVRARLTTLGCDYPATLCLLPLNLDTASSVDQLEFPTTAATVHKLFRHAGLSCDEILPNEVLKRYKLNRADELILPILLVTMQWLHDNRTTLIAALDMLVAYLRRLLPSGDQHQVCLEIVREDPNGRFTKISYKGSSEGLHAVLHAEENRMLVHEERLEDD